MDKEEFMEIAGRPGVVAGIHNYCDRWCERCLYTRLCSVYAIGEAQVQENPGADPFARVGEMLAAALEMAREWAAENGVDPDSEEARAAWEELERRKRQHGTHPLESMAKEYYKQARAWFDSARELYEQKGRELESRAEMDMEGDEAEIEAAELADSTDIIQWYQAFILAKLHRATGDLGEQTGDAEEDGACEYDANGSAKIALLAIDRSMAAWAKLLECFPCREASILDLLVRLEDLRREAEKTFPNARAFVRPGLDEGIG